MLCAVEVPRDEVFNYGVFDIAEIPSGSGLPAERVKQVTGMVEKPDPADAPSRLVATGRYLLDRGIFDALRRTRPGKGGEIQLTDAIELMIREGHPVHIVVHEGKRHDLGNPAGYIPACVDFGLSHPTYGPGLKRAITAILAEHEAAEIAEAELKKIGFSETCSASLTSAAAAFLDRFPLQPVSGKLIQHDPPLPINPASSI